MPPFWVSLVADRVYPSQMCEISVVIPAFNAAPYLRETVASVLSSNSVKTEIVIVDDGSTDQTVEVAHQLMLEYPKAIHVIEQKNAGVSVARNTGFSRARAPAVCFLDADDILRPDALATLKTLLDQDAKCIAAYGSVAYIDQDSKPLRFRPKRTPLPSGNLLASILEGNLIDTPGAVLFRSSAVDCAGMFKAGLRRSQDWEFYVRMAQQGTFASYHGVVLDYRLHSKSLSHESSTAGTFDEALSLAFSSVRDAGALPEHLLRRLEARRRASTLRLIAIRSHSLSATTLAAMLRLCLSSGLDGRVLRTTLRTTFSALKSQITPKYLRRKV
ncbi:MAG: glycosyltransferase family 2 protein [Hymenobacter sp.]|nr:MAG: glycosyltransferase family 2 protein [Hymenobacter sp.]